MFRYFQRLYILPHLCVSEGSHKLSSMCLIKLADKTLPRKCGEKWLTARIGHLLAPLYPSKPQSFQFMASFEISWFPSRWCTRYTHCTCRPCTYPLKHKIIFKYVLVNYSKEDSACTTWNSLINFLLSFLFDLMKNLNTLSLGCGDHGFHRKSTLVRLTKCQCRMCILLHTTIALELNTPDFFNSDLSLILLCETYIAKSGFLFMVWSQILLFPVLLLCL